MAKLTASIKEEYGKLTTSSISSSSSSAPGLASFAFTPTVTASITVTTTSASAPSTGPANVDSLLTDGNNELTKRRKIALSDIKEKFVVTVPDLVTQPESSTSSPRAGSEKRSKGHRPVKPSTSSSSSSGGRRSPRNAAADGPAILSSQIETAPGVSSSSSIEGFAEIITPITTAAAETHEVPAVVIDNASNAILPAQVSVYTYVPFLLLIVIFSHPNMTSIICSM